MYNKSCAYSTKIYTMSCLSLSTLCMSCFNMHGKYLHYYLHGYMIQGVNTLKRVQKSKSLNAMLHILKWGYTLYSVIPNPNILFHSLLRAHRLILA